MDKNKLYITFLVGFTILALVVAVFRITQMFNTNSIVEDQESKKETSCWECNLEKKYIIDQIYNSREQKVVFRNTSEEGAKVVADIYNWKNEDWDKMQTIDIFEAESVKLFEPTVMWGKSRLEIKYQVDNQAPIVKGLYYSSNEEFDLFVKGQVYSSSGEVYYEDKYLYREDDVVDRIDVAGMTNDEVIAEIETKGYDLPDLVIGKGELSSIFKLINDEVVFTEVADNEDGEKRNRIHLNYLNKDGKFLEITSDSAGSIKAYEFSIGDDNIVFDGLGYSISRKGYFNGEEFIVWAYFSRDYSAGDVIDYLYLR